MNGYGPIVLATRQENFVEHPDLDTAEREAHRLVMERGVEVAVVYVPKRIVRKEPVVVAVTTHIRGNGRPETGRHAPVTKLALK